MIEYLTVFTGAIIAVTLFVLTYFIKDNKFSTTIAVLFIFSGGFLIAFGFWGADFAMSIAEGAKEKVVNVPFMRTYTTGEWWNLNWAIVTIGVLIAMAGTLLMRRVM